MKIRNSMVLGLEHLKIRNSMAWGLAHMKIRNCRVGRGAVGHLKSRNF